jgi:hypothetical protein
MPGGSFVLYLHKAVSQPSSTSLFLGDGEIWFCCLEMTIMFFTLCQKVLATHQALSQFGHN